MVGDDAGWQASFGNLPWTPSVLYKETMHISALKMAGVTALHASEATRACRLPVHDRQAQPSSARKRLGDPGSPGMERGTRVESLRLARTRDGRPTSPGAHGLLHDARRWVLHVSGGAEAWARAESPASEGPPTPGTEEPDAGTTDEDTRPEGPELLHSYRSDHAEGEGLSGLGDEAQPIVQGGNAFRPLAPPEAPGAD